MPMICVAEERKLAWCAILFTRQSEDSTSGSIAPVSVEARASSRSYMRWRFSQNSGVIPNVQASSPPHKTNL